MEPLEKLQKFLIKSGLKEEVYQSYAYKVNARKSV